VVFLLVVLCNRFLVWYFDIWRVIDFVFPIILGLVCWLIVLMFSFVLYTFGCLLWVVCLVCVWVLCFVLLVTLVVGL